MAFLIVYRNCFKLIKVKFLEINQLKNCSVQALSTNSVCTAGAYADNVALHALAGCTRVAQLR